MAAPSYKSPRTIAANPHTKPARPVSREAIFLNPTTPTRNRPPTNPGRRPARDSDRVSSKIMMSGGGGGSSNGAGPSSFGFERHAKRRPPATPASDQQRKLLRLSMQHGQGDEDALAAGVVPPVTVVLDGRCICHRVHLTRHTGYRSLAGALRRMFVDDAAEGDDDDGLDLSNAVPGHVVAYEDMEDDLLLVGDLNWKDFVRVAKRIRIIPAKSTTRRIKQCGGGVN